MDTTNTKEAFADICDRIWTRILKEEKLDEKTARGMRRIIAHLVMVSWNTCVTSKKLEDAKDTVIIFASEYYDEADIIIDRMLNAVSIKWHDYRKDKTIIENTEVKYTKGKPQAIAHLKGEHFVPDVADSVLAHFVESPGVQERLRAVPPEQQQEEMDEMQAEYFAFAYGKYDATGVVLEEEPSKFSDEDRGKKLNEFPLGREIMDDVYTRILRSIPIKDSLHSIRETLKEQPCLAPICGDFKRDFLKTENARLKTKTKGAYFRHPGSVSEIVIAIESVYALTTGFWKVPFAFESKKKDAAKIASAFLDEGDQSKFNSLIQKQKEPNLLAFICENVFELFIHPSELRPTMETLLAWGLAIGEVREKKN